MNPLLSTSARALGRFVALTVRRGRDNSIYLVASALAFISILALIPVLAASAFVGARVFTRYRERSLEILSDFLPYASEDVVDRLAEFLTQAESLTGLGVLIFVGSSIALFATIEKSLNQIWNVYRRRPLRVRALSFLLVLIWGPILIGATYTSLVLLQRTATAVALIEASLLVKVSLFALKVAGLTMLYRLVPYTRVRMRSALAGGVVAALLLELLRKGFALYVAVFPGFNLIYGSFAFGFFLAISLELSWMIVLIGCEVAYTAQYFPALSRRKEAGRTLPASWLGLAALARIAHEQTPGNEVLSRERLAAELALPTPGLNRMLAPLLGAGLLREVGGAHGGFVLARRSEEIEIESVLEIYDHRTLGILEPLEGRLADRLEELFSGAIAARSRLIGATTLAELLPGKDQPAPQGSENEEVTSQE